MLKVESSKLWLRFLSNKSKSKSLMDKKRLQAMIKRTIRLAKFLDRLASKPDRGFDYQQKNFFKRVLESAKALLEYTKKQKNGNAVNVGRPAFSKFSDYSQAIEGFFTYYLFGEDKELRNEYLDAVEKITKINSK